MKPNHTWHPDTQALHSGHRMTGERENSPALFLTSSFVFESARQAQDIFSEKEQGNIYSRFTNPTVALFEERLAAMERAEKCVATASGMAAITALFLSLLSKGDHVVISRSVFGSTSNIAKTVLPRFGIQVSRVDLSDLNAWRAAITPQTKLLFAETPANPTLELVDLRALGEIARQHNVLLAIDNVFCTPVLQQPLLIGAHLVIHSATKYLDGQGRVLGGAILGDESLIMEQIFPFIRNTGPALSPFNAWIILKGLETLSLRVERHCENAERLARFLTDNYSDFNDSDSRLSIHYPALPDYPQHQLASRQMNRFGGVVCLDLGTKEQAHSFLDHLKLATITANLGDSRTLATHPATTTHGKLTPEDRLKAGVTDGLVRLSVGLENSQDILEDVDQALIQSGFKANRTVGSPPHPRP